MLRGMAMALPTTLVAVVLISSGVQASDIADGSMNYDLLLKFMPLRSGSSKSSIGIPFMTYSDKPAHPTTPFQDTMEFTPDQVGAFGTSKNLEPQMIANKDVQHLFTNTSNKPIGLSAIGVALFLFAEMAMVAIVRGRLWGGMPPAIAHAHASSGKHEMDMSIPMAPVSVNNNLDLKSQGSPVGIPEQVLQGSERALAKDIHTDIKSQFAVWDSFGLGEAAPKAHVENFRESELQHGRAFLTAVYSVSPQKPRPMHTLMLANGHEDRIMDAHYASGISADTVAAPPQNEAFIDRHPLIAKSLSMGITYGLADATAQLFAFLAHGEVVPLAARFRRAISLTGVGCLAVGPLLTVWFDFLEHIVPGRTKRAVLKRTVLDQVFEVPVMISIIFTLSSLAEGHSLAFCLTKIQLKLLTTWKDCTSVWFPVQFINQGLVPLKFRVIFQAVVSFFWDTYLSIVSHSVAV